MTVELLSMEKLKVYSGNQKLKVTHRREKTEIHMHVYTNIYKLLVNSSEVVIIFTFIKTLFVGKFDQKYKEST